MNFEQSEINEPLKLLLHPSYKIGMKGYINLAVFGLYKLSPFLVLVLVLKIFKKRIHKKKNKFNISTSGQEKNFEFSNSSHLNSDTCS